MRRVILEAFRDEQTGEIGLGIVTVRARHPEMNAATEGLLIAHDLIEHVNGPEAIGTIDDELEALGAIWYVRGQHGELRRDRVGSASSIEENIASDVVRMYRDIIAGGAESRFELGSLRGRECEVEQTLQDILGYAERDYLSEIDDDQKREARKRWPGFRWWALVRMRAGYRKARRRWEARGRFAANTQFWAIVEAVEPYTKHSDEGQRYVLKYGDGEAQCTEAYDENDWR